MLRPLILLVLLLTAPLAQAAGSKAELAAVDRLGAVNGTVRACGYLELVSRIKGAMILYVRETREMGATFENATQRGYGALVGDVTRCPQRAQVRATVEQAVEGIKRAFPLNVGG